MYACTLYNCQYSIVQLTGASLASKEVSLTLVNKYKDRYTAVFIELLPQLKNTMAKNENQEGLKAKEASDPWKIFLKILRFYQRRLKVRSASLISKKY